MNCLEGHATCGKAKNELAKHRGRNSRVCYAFKKAGLQILLAASSPALAAASASVWCLMASWRSPNKGSESTDARLFPSKVATLAAISPPSLHDLEGAIR